MKIDAFAEFVGHGAPMLKHIEAGRKPLSDELAVRISEKTGVPLTLLLSRILTKRDQARVAKREFSKSWNPKAPEECVALSLSLMIPTLATALLAQKASPAGASAVANRIGVELARIARDFNIPSSDVHGLTKEIGCATLQIFDRKAIRALWAIPAVRRFSRAPDAAPVAKR